MATYNGAFYNRAFMQEASGLLSATSAEVDTDNVGAELTVLDDVRNILYLPDKIRICDWYFWQQLNDTNGTQLLELEVQVTDGTTTKTLVPQFKVSASGAADLVRAQSTDPLGEKLDGGNGLWTVKINVKVAAATAGTVGEAVFHIQYEPIR